MRTIVLENKIIEYDLKRNAKRNINISIKPDLTLIVSAPRWVLISDIEQVLYEKSKWIIKNLDEQKVRKESSKKNTLESGSKLWFKGSEYLLNYEQSNKNAVKINENTVTVYSKRALDMDYSKNILSKWFKENAEVEFWDILEKYRHLMMSKYKMPICSLCIRDMKTRWGTCIPSKNKVTMNLNLIYAPSECIEYIALHELTHFIEIHHNRHFYSIVEEYMPDYKERKKLLNKEFSQVSG